MKTKTFFLSAAIICLCISAHAQHQQMYGMTTSGGAYGGGTLLRMNTDGTFDVEHAFQPPAGFLPMGNLVTVSDGKLYGVCFEGGTNNSCTIFCWDSTKRTYTDVYDFDITNGDFPTNTPVEISNGILVGTGIGGGTTGYGVIYVYDVYTDTYTSVYEFPVIDTIFSSSSFQLPFGGVMQHSSGKLYGMTVYGGSHKAGTIYSFDFNTFTEVHHFDTLNGKNPYGGLIELSNGKLYGMTSEGGANNLGVIFSFDPSNNTYSVLHNFSMISGQMPYGSLIEGSNGLLYGMTSSGGANYVGVIFSLDPVNNNYAVVHHFNGTQGSMYGNFNPISFSTMPLSGGLSETGGVLYGTAVSGGALGYGVVFNYDISTNVYEVMLDLDSATYGIGPSGGFITVTDNAALAVAISGNNTACVGDDITLTATMQHGLGPFDFIWNTGATAQSINTYPVEGINQYSVTVTDHGKNQTDAQSMEVTGITEPSDEISVTVNNNTVSIDYDLTDVPEYTVDYGDGTYPGTALEHTYATNGTFPITLSATNDCGSKTLNESATITGVFIGSVANTFALDVYPNPGNGIITVSFTQTAQPFSLMIYDVSGKKIYEEQISTASGMNNHRLDLSALSKGLYTLRLNAKEGSGMQKLLIY